MAALLLACAGASQAQQTVDGVLAEVERNNASLAARRKLTDAQTLEARTGNSLENPEVEYEHMWGNRSELGKEGELTVKQEFDFPTVYANRNKMAKAQAELFGHEYAAYRQQILLDAKNLCIEITALRRKQEYLADAFMGAMQVAENMTKRVEAGDANALEQNKALFEFAAARNAFQSNEIELAAAINRLTNLNGGMPIELASDAGDISTPLLSLEETLAKYEQASPELLAILAEKAAADHYVKLSRSMSMPKLGLGYKFTHAGREKFNGVVVGMSIPMFGNRNNVKRAKAQAAYAEVEASRARIDLRSDLEQLYAQAELLESVVEQYAQILDHDKTIELLAKALDAGHISVSDYYDQLQPVFDNRLATIEMRRDYDLVCAKIGMIDL